MLLSDREIEKFIREGKIKIKPLPNFKDQLGPASLDLRLGKEFRVFNQTNSPFVDPKNPKTFLGTTKLVKIKNKNYFVLHPGEFVLGITLEEITLPANIAARIEGRSSWGRLGLLVHSTAGYVDPGFSGRLTLEISNIGKVPILLYPGLKICQLSFELLSSPSKLPYNQRKNSKYLNDKLPTESKIYKDIQKI